MAVVNGTQGYEDAADELVRRYESIAFAEVHRTVRHLFPAAPARVLDIGAGTGRDAAGFAALGYDVVAVEPTAGLRTRAVALHPSPRIEWVDDGLPGLARLHSRGERFALIMLTAVWMHLDAVERQRGMPKLAHLAAPGGLVVMSLRHGPVPAGRRMFEVTAAETVELAASAGFRLILLRENVDSALCSPGVRWTRLAFSAGDKT